MKKNGRLLLLSIVWIFLSCNTPSINQGDREILQRFWEYAATHNLKNREIGERVSLTAHFFMETPYAGHTLDTPEGEKLVVNLRGVDCVTFVENVLALALLRDYNSAETERFVHNLQRIRYREGKIVDYTSRLHYSSDWLHEMQRQHLLQDVTLTAGGTIYDKKVCFMSQHSNRYPALKANKELTAKIEEIETAINQRTYHYIPKAEVEKAYPYIQEGDILLITTNIAGLDTSHLGFAVKKAGKVYLLHASSDKKKVVENPQPLKEYMESIPSQSGIIVGRCIDGMAQDLIEQE